MESLYYIYDYAQAPPELLAKYPNAARYGTAVLFVQGIESLTGVPPALTHNLAGMLFNHPYTEGEEGLTGDQLIAVATQLFAPDPPPTSAEVPTTKAQANHIKEIMFPTTETGL